MKLYKIKKSNIDKKGLYASKNIKAGTKIINYIGKIITNKFAEESNKFDNRKNERCSGHCCFRFFIWFYNSQNNGNRLCNVL